jgi:hypothetical protein
MKRSSILAAVGALALLAVIGFPRFRAYLQGSDPNTRLTSLALQSLKDEYDVLVTGKAPLAPLIPHDDEWGHPRSSDERLADVLGRRRLATEEGRPYTSVDVDLEPHGVENVHDGIILHATEQVTLHYKREGRVVGPEYDVTKMRLEHDFVFKDGPSFDQPVLLADRQPPRRGFDASSPELVPGEKQYAQPEHSPTRPAPTPPAKTNDSRRPNGE